LKSARLPRPVLSALRRQLRYLSPLLVLWLALWLTPAVRAQGQDVDIDVFYEALAPYGRWFEHAVWGTVWQPTVDPGWRPYTRGMWLYSDAEGWYWDAEEPWGWGPFHYGRWLFDAGAWIWLPDTEWGPAWVAWRISDDYAGWAPLPPQAVWGADGVLVLAAAILAGPNDRSQWCFVRPHQLNLPGLYRYLLPRRQAELALAATRPLYPQRKGDGGIRNAGFDVARLERMTGRPVARLRLKSVEAPQASNAGRVRGYGQDVSVYRPRLVAPGDGGGRLHPALVARQSAKPPAPSSGREGGALPAAGAGAGGQGGAGQPAGTPPADPGAPTRPAPAASRGPVVIAPGKSGRPHQDPAAATAAAPGQGPTPAPPARRTGGPANAPSRATNSAPPVARPRPAPSAAPPAAQPMPAPATRGPAPDQRRQAPPRDDNRGPGN